MKIKKKISIFCLLILSVMACSVHADDGRITVARAFYELAHQNNPQRIKSLIDRGYSIESQDQRGMSSVCLAIVRQDRIAYRNLISAGANKNPSCIKKIPEETLKKFFGKAPVSTFVAPTSDTPYLIGAAALGTAALATAYILRGDIDKGGDSPTPPTPEVTCQNGKFNETTKHCDCDSGYDNYGDDKNCYSPISHCSDQEKGDCTSCEENYVQSNGKCYESIAHCIAYSDGICTQCETGYGVHGGDGQTCYTDIPYCSIQKEITCEQCIDGYGTHGDTSTCYENIENCFKQVQTACVQCNQGYDTYGDPEKRVCYASNPCSAYPNTVPVSTSEGMECKCNEENGYYGEPGNCSQSEEGDYQEGEGNKEEWNNLNTEFCNSHGKYDSDADTCTCYRGYAPSGKYGCSECAEGYIDPNLRGICYKDLNCGNKGDHFVQSSDKCVCEDGYIEYNGECTESATCPIHYEQVRPGIDPEEACECKPNFDENCENCIEGFVYDLLSDTCIEKEMTCNENWIGAQCDICPAPFRETEEETGEKHCTECLSNRAPASKDPTCMTCADGYKWSDMDNNCIITNCSQGIVGYIEKNGQCICDEENGYVGSITGECVKKAPDLIGIKDTNINNETITLINQGSQEGIRDVYGMKPILSEDGEGNIEYYDNVYNALSPSGSAVGTININNIDAGANVVYGIYAPSVIYNAASISTDRNASAQGTINIKDNTYLSYLYGLYGTGDNSIYNAFARNEGEGTASNPIGSTAIGTIKITKEEKNKGNIIGISGNGYIYNAYANTENGTAANAKADGKIELENKGQGTVIGIKGDNASKKINNSLSFLGSAISDAVSLGTIKVTGNGTVYGIYGNSTIVNSETQFNKSFNVVNDFSSHGIIEATSLGDKVYGIFLENFGNTNVELYNAMGYNSVGDIIISQQKGGSAYGMWNSVQTYSLEEEGISSIYYTNTYNAFRSSAKYGGDNTAAKGTIKINIDNTSNGSQETIGIYSAGNLFNSYINSGADVKLESQGIIKIADNSNTSGMKIKGMESGGATVANAYAYGHNANTTSLSKADISINITGSKQGSDGFAAGIYNTEPSEMVANIYNAALVNDQSNVIGNISLTSTGIAALGRMYGIYASKYNINSSNSEDEGQEKNVYNAYYNNSDATVYNGSVSGNIVLNVPSRSNISRTEYYGIYVNMGTAYNAYSTNAAADVKGTIELDVGGGENGGIAVGMYGNKASVYNSGRNSSITVNASRMYNNAYGLKGKESYLENSAVMNITSNDAQAFGLYADGGQAVNTASGTINVSGATGSYGIYVISDGTVVGSAQAINNGTINLSGIGPNIGIYASGATATVQNTGTIKIDGSSVNNTCMDEECTSAAIQLVNGASFVNSGSMSVNGNLNLSSIGENIILNTGGSFNSTESINGNLQISSDTVKDTFDKTVVLKNAISATDVSELDMTSGSYLYTPKLVSNGENQYNVTLEMKDFSEIADDESEAEYLKQNYENKRNMTFFNALKTATNQNETEIIKNKMEGKNILPNITEEELNVQRSLDTQMLSDLFKEGTDIRKIVGTNSNRVGRRDHGTLSGYDINSHSIYALYDKKTDNQYRLGLGMSITHTNTDYNDDSRRKNFMIQGYVPLTYMARNGITAVSMARLGYGEGDYTRKGHDGSYKADTKEITYGLLNQARYTYSLGGTDLTPFIGINAIGWYQDGISEGNTDLAVHIASSQVFSIESVLGLYIDKEIEINEASKLGISLGLGYYHEFADPYKGTKAHNTNMGAPYRLKNTIHSRDRGILSAKIDYDYHNLTLYGQIMQYLQTDHPIEVEGGLKYKF